MKALSDFEMRIALKLRIMRSVPQRGSVWLAEVPNFEFLSEPHATALWYRLHDTTARVLK